MKIGTWKKIFRYRDKVSVDVGGKTELLTHTQSFRFSQIAENRDVPSHAARCDPLEDEPYRLQDAALHLMVTEDDVLASGAAGVLPLYVDVAGRSGRWCRQDQSGDVSQSAVATIRSGLLRLQAKACADLARHGRAIVQSLNLCTAHGRSRAGVDDATLTDLRALGPGDLQFFPLHPLTVERDMVFLIPPLEYVIQQPVE